MNHMAVFLIFILIGHSALAQTYTLASVTKRISDCKNLSEEEKRSRIEVLNKISDINFNDFTYIRGKVCLDTENAAGLTGADYIRMTAQLSRLQPMSNEIIKRVLWRIVNLQDGESIKGSGIDFADLFSRLSANEIPTETHHELFKYAVTVLEDRTNECKSGENQRLLYGLLEQKNLNRNQIWNFKKQFSDNIYACLRKSKPNGERIETARTQG